VIDRNRLNLLILARSALFIWCEMMKKAMDDSSRYGEDEKLFQSVVISRKCERLLT
jgi:hypothetical protein